MSPAPLGNQFWKARTKVGRDKIFKTPDDLEKACFEYVEWVNDNPLEKSIVYQGVVSKAPENLMRAMTVKGLCIFLGVNKDYFTDFMDNLDKTTTEGKAFTRVIKTIRDIIDTQKFEGAAAGLLNPVIIARDLGLKDRTDVSSEDGSMTPKGFNDFYDSDKAKS